MTWTASTLYARLLGLADSPEVRALDPGLKSWLQRNRAAVLSMLAVKLDRRHPADASFADAAGPVHYTLTLPQVEQAIRALPREHMAIFAEDGRQLWRCDPPTTHAILCSMMPHLSDADVERLYPTTKVCAVSVPAMHAVQAAQETVLTHNHPSGKPLSTTDLQLARRLNLREIRAVAPDGGVCLARRRGTTWGAAEIAYDVALTEAMIQASRWLDEYMSKHGSVNHAESQAEFLRRIHRVLDHTAFDEFNYVRLPPVHG